MATINWPTNLRPALKASKSRSQTVGFRESSPTVGPSFVEPFSDDTPTIYNIQFTFTKGEAAAFQSWLRINQIRFLSPFFNFPLKIEGLTQAATQEARFTVSGYPQLTSETNAIFTYSAQILIRSLDIPDEAYDEFLLELGEATGYKQLQFMSELDFIVNTQMVIA